MQLVFGWDAILNIKHVADWEHIRQRKQLRIIHNNMWENMRQNNHQYKVGDKILVKHKKNSKHELEFMGSFYITQINDTGTVCFQKGIINDATNIRRIKPFFNLKKQFLQQQLFLFKTHDNGTVHFQQGIFNDNTAYTSNDYILISHISLLWSPAP